MSVSSTSGHACRRIKRRHALALWFVSAAMLPAGCHTAPDHGKDLDLGFVEQQTSAAPEGGVNAALPVGVGFTSSPTTFLMSVAGDVPVADQVTLGPSFQLGHANDWTLVGVTSQAKYHFELEGDASRWTPFVQGGVGFLYLDRERTPAPGSNDDIGLLLDAGGGVRYRVNDPISLGSQMMFHLMPGGVLDDNFYFSWEIVQVVFNF